MTEDVSGERCLRKLLQYLRFQNKPPHWRALAIPCVGKKTVLMFSKGRKLASSLWNKRDTHISQQAQPLNTSRLYTSVFFLNKNTHSPPQSKYFSSFKTVFVITFLFGDAAETFSAAFACSQSVIGQVTGWSTLLLKPFRVGLLESEVGFFETAKFFAKSNFLFSLIK